ncbi:hypothetical protein JEU11_06655 [Paraglaciecola chathamensis]|uniref:Uncharacterized protein n=1 Tax=Paraglaciecola chathamensis TaxID=368405 RepID=A0ABS0WCC6_9ALTE|nr:hypothetical protein [Paraglaciecola chathamensis]MBJ2136127.1 hypothetical protein [Paraglaciecola chathamensis]
MKKVLNGFLLGLGFSIAFASFMTIWAITAQPRIEAMFEESYSKVKSDFDSSFIDSMGLKIDKTVIQDQSVLINYKVNNIGSGLASLYSVRFTLKASNGQFMGNCDHQIPEAFTNNNFIFLSVRCSDLQLPANEFDVAIASVIKNRQQF